MTQTDLNWDLGFGYWDFDASLVEDVPFVQRMTKRLEDAGERLRPNSTLMKY